MPLSPEQFQRYAKEESKRQRSMFETQEGVRTDGRDDFGEPSDTEYQKNRFRISDPELMEMGLAPRPRRADLPRGVGKLPALAKLGVELPAGVPELLERLDAVEATYRDLTKRISKASERARQNDIDAQKNRVEQLKAGVKPEDLEPFVPAPTDEPFSISDLRELQDNAHAARTQVSRELSIATDQDEFFPYLSAAFFNSFVPSDFESSKAEIEAEERKGEEIRKAILSYQTTVGFYPDERGARKEYVRLCEKLGGPVHLDDWVDYRGGSLTLNAIRVRPEDEVPETFDPADLELVLDEAEVA